jgi:hypothetical protein
LVRVAAWCDAVDFCQIIGREHNVRGRDAFSSMCLRDFAPGIGTMKTLDRTKLSINVAESS